MRGQQALDLVVRVPALLIGATRMQDGGTCTRGTVLIFRADAREVDGLAWAVDGDNLAEAPLGPFRWVVAPDLQALRHHRGLRDDGCNDENGGEPADRRHGASSKVDLLRFRDTPAPSGNAARHPSLDVDGFFAFACSRPSASRTARTCSSSLSAAPWIFGN